MSDLIGWLLAAGWSLATIVLLRDVPAIRALPAGRSRPEGAGEPTVSVIVTARDEAQRIRTTVLRLAEQRGIDLELVVVDDRSTDGTGRILDELAGDDPRIRVHHVTELPAGWVGKTHACEVGAAEASGAWLLFTDADAWMRPDLVARAVTAAETEGVDHVCLIPGERSLTVGAEAGVLSFFLGVLPIAARVNRDRLRAPVGVGAFNLVRRAAYRAIGGHRPLRLEILDDAKLGFLLLSAGFRTRVFHSRHELEVDWSGSLPGVIRALEKNLFAALGFSVPWSLAAVLTMVGPWLATVIACAQGTIAGAVAGLALLSIVAPAIWLARRARFGVLAAMLTPVALPVAAVALIRSAWTTLRQGGVRWRDTFYPLEELRRGVVR